MCTNFTSRKKGLTGSPWHMLVPLVIDGVVELGGVTDLGKTDLDKSEMIQRKKEVARNEVI